MNLYTFPFHNKTPFFYKCKSANYKGKKMLLSESSNVRDTIFVIMQQK